MNLEMLKKILNIPDNATIEEVVKSIIIYLRKSRKDMDYFKNEPIEKTLKRHEDDLQEWAVKTLGIKIPEENIYKEVVSGDTIEARPKMQEVLNIIENDEIKAVLCVEIERLARGNTIDQGIIAQSFQYSKTKIITPYKIYNLDNEDDLTYFEDGLYQSRKYLLYVKKILRRGRIRSVQDGKYIGATEPYGYKKKKLINEKGYTLELNDNEVKVVKLIADLFVHGIDTTYIVKENDTIPSITKIYSMKKAELIELNPDSKFMLNDKIIIKSDMGTSAIATYLNYLNIEPRKAKQWTPNMIKNILTSPTVYGYVTWGARETTKIKKDGQIIKYRPRNNNCMKVKGNFEPIINPDSELAKLIDDKISNNKTNRLPNQYDLKNPLSGLVICPNCQKKMIRRPYNKNNHVDTLYCKTARCETVGSNLELIETRLLDSLKGVLEEYNNYIDNYNDEYKKEVNNSNNLISIIDNEIEKTNSKLEKCFDLLEDGTYNKEVFKKRVDKLNLELSDLNERKKELSNIDIIQKFEERRKAIPLLQTAIDSYEKCDTINSKNELLKSIVDEVIYFKTRGGKGYEDKFDLKIKLKI